jgi:hypothetical protein
MPSVYLYLEWIFKPYMAYILAFVICGLGIEPVDIKKTLP